MEHGAFEADEEPEQLAEAGAVQRARGAVGRGLDGQRVAHPRHRHVALAAQLPGEHGAGRTPRGHVPEGPRARARGESGEQEETPYRASRRTMPSYSRSCIATVAERPSRLESSSSANSDNPSSTGVSRFLTASRTARGTMLWTTARET